MIPDLPKPECADCQKGGSSYDMKCRGCVGRWLRFLRGLKAGESSFQSWCKSAAKRHGRNVVTEFLKESAVRGYE